MKLLRMVLLSVLFANFILSCEEKPASHQGLTHCVFLDLRPGISAADQQRIKDTLLSLGNIEEVRSISVVDKTDVGDSRALDYDIMLIATFEDKMALSSYDKNPDHQMVRDFLKPYMAGAPATFDFEE